MTNLHLERALEVTKSAVTEAGQELIKHYGTIKAETKSATGETVSDVVTRLDGQTEDLLADRLGKFDPTIGFRGEESGVRSESDTTWLVDPIDGTSHFVRGLPFCTTMVALIEKNEVIMSVIHDFVRDDTYWAIKGQGAFRNGERLRVSTRPSSEALLSFETRIADPKNLATYAKVQAFAGLVCTMNCGFEFSAIASGKLEGRLAKDPYGGDWDYAPGSLLVTEAGGIATNIGSSEYDYQNHDYLITNALIHEQLTTGQNAIFPLESI